MLDHFLMRIAESEYKRTVIIKGGMLIAALLGDGNRSTMDLDTTLKHFTLNESELRRMVDEIVIINLDDDIRYEFVSLSPIRKDDDYGGLRVVMKAFFDTLEIPFKIDVTTGDIITPCEQNFNYSPIFEDKPIDVLAYPIETVLAEKLETIIRRSIATTRIRDYYDIWALYDKYNEQIDFINLREALLATAEHRETDVLTLFGNDFIEAVKNDSGLQRQWSDYQQEFDYAANIDWSSAIDTIEILMRTI